MLRSEADGDGFIEVLIDDDTAAIDRAPPALFVDLQDQVVEFDIVVAIDRPLGLIENTRSRSVRLQGTKAVFLWLCGLDSKPLIEVPDMASL